jgi:hypothetical protein
VLAGGNQAIYGRGSSYHGGAYYYPSVGAAKSTGRVGNNPLVIYATGKVDDQWDRDVIIAGGDAAKIAEANKVGKFLEKYRVAIVIE